MNALVGRPLVPGEAEGEVLFASEPLSFWGGYDSETGEIIDRRHPLSGQNGAGRVLVIPSTRGSSTTAAVLLESLRSGTGPCAIVTQGPDLFVALASTVASELYGTVLPIVALEPDDFERLHDVSRVRVSATGQVTEVG